jgi:hypothetical protein
LTLVGVLRLITDPQAQHAPMGLVARAVP